MPQITVLYFAAPSTATNLTYESIALPSPDDSRTDVDFHDFRLSSLPALLWSVDAEMVDNPEDVVLKGGEEVAVICPVSGG
ncbi:hypothetical protein PUNSTDRAFT_134750 [Punctularia strigosozonata HHB-11173 SS5]|uniref:uncharacterized protein n=1 Tax=Punctularia strigosozonata (strain HHB-11173) TaxID=741275 RepID=UPI0004417884|nr:uncharacterized protein PUNSTDRAFT_134750 [Punctularia strigosozonata HHB-11173 SS5]EIN08363.1 hypothetical protein PUNSTDRAFT_134750 [Punctularia strigosozonata HHB-11173 SS5]